MKTALDHLPERKQQELHTITTVLRDTLDDFLRNKNGSKAEFRILKIILFGSHAKGTWVSDRPNGYISDYDILVIVNRSSLVEEYAVWHSAEEQIARRVTSAPLGLIVHTLNEVHQQLQQGHYFFADIREQGIELFSADKRELPMPGNLSEAERVAIASKHFSHWFESAEQHEKYFRIMFENKDLNLAAFMLHQATERFFACTLLVCTNYLPKTHNIESLRSMCAQQDPAFAELFPMDNKFHRRSFQRLKRAYIDARYSEHYEITAEELTYLQSEVDKLREITERVCRGRITP
ncbi:HEPN domain-containing protein [Vibrio gazogenes]|uniref:HEPN domain-containing protein n=1 Tax=Vibrio gazogenes DSM 21264 = NBRC 103151 TaxID=1123492 RepID=A0A1M5FN09_VIBGA|nr:HEPN domain-containing protein [Vibrio gazogenes]USP14491.1 HEPN domain-containing protein [Vibrio gazogenes]SHF92552.1 HEPN domain-containing protein [Vibrio gazogenes DSM 21264] [Vibrio gazogenes DSM 21264 = NBRC 103151]SJN57639.1 HEPN domain protein [Vibrio gazogenes]